MTLLQVRDKPRSLFSGSGEKIEGVAAIPAFWAWYKHHLAEGKSIWIKLFQEILCPLGFWWPTCDYEASAEAGGNERKSEIRFYL